CIRSVEAWVFNKYPLTPARSASTTYGSSVCIVSRMVRVSGETFPISLAASKPFNCGIARSKTAMSGRCFWASWTASRPSPASATTVHCSCSRNDFKPCRTIKWSSANRIRSGILCLQRDLGLKRCPLTGSGDDSVVASDRIESLSYPGEPEARVAFPVHDSRDVEADPVIRNDTPDQTTVLLQSDRGTAGLRVP